MSPRLSPPPRLRHAALAAALPALLSGCGALSPYQHMPLAPTLPAAATPALDALSPAGSASNASAPLAGGLSASLAALEAQRLSYFDKLDASAVRRTLGAETLYAVGGWALLSGMKQKPTDADTLRTTRLAVAGSTMYLAADQGINNDQEQIHARAYNALTCLALQAQPLAWPLHDDTKDTPTKPMLAAATPALDATAEDTKPSALPPRITSRAALAQQITALEQLINTGYRTRDELTQLRDKNAFAPHVKRAISERDKALTLARTAWREALVLLTEIDRSGALVQGRSTLIVSNANIDLQAHQKALPGAEGKLVQMRSLFDSLRNVGKETEAQESAGSGDEDTGKPPPPTLSAPTTEGDKAGATAATAASGATADTSTDTRTDTGTKGKPATAAATQADLAQLKEALTTLIVDAKARAQAQVTQAKTPRELAQEKSLAALQKRFDEQGRQLQQARLCSDAGTTPSCPSDGALKTFRDDTNALHATRRPLVAALLGFRQATRAVAAHESCSSLPKLVRITPSNPAQISVPATLDFVVSVAGAGVPRVGLNGPNGEQPGSLTVRVENGLVLARVTLDKGQPAGELTLWATDPNGRHGDEVTLTVKAQ